MRNVIYKGALCEVDDVFRINSRERQYKRVSMNKEVVSVEIVG